jgi:hypothetical protein
MASYEIWDTESRNLVADYDSEDAALGAVAEAALRYGVDEIRTLMLVRVGPRGGSKRIAIGSHLADLAMQAVGAAEAVG